MEEENNALELKEKLEEVGELGANWRAYLAITTAFIAVLAAIASLQSSSYSNLAILEKNNSILAQSKASDQWSFYQAKGIKKNLAESFYGQSGDAKLKGEVDRYAKEQNEIRGKAEEFEKQVEEANAKSEKFFERHHQAAISVTFFQVAIALSAMSALLKRKSFWYLSVILSLISLRFLALGVLLK